MAKSPAWQRKEGKNPNGGLNAKGRASAKAQGMNLKPPQPEGGSRRDSFCARGHEEEADQREDGQRSEFAHQQIVARMEMLSILPSR